MIDRGPVGGVGNEKALHFFPAHVKTARAPALVLHPVLALILVKRAAVKFIKAVRVLRKMGGHPVQDHADPRAVQDVHKLHKIPRRAETGGGRVISADLIAPRAVKGVLHHRQQFHMGISHGLDIGGKILRQLPVGKIGAVLVPPERPQVHFVNVERLAVSVLAHGPGAVGKPPGVMPFVSRKIGIDRGGFGRFSRTAGIRVGLVKTAVGRIQQKFIKRALAKTPGRDPSFKNAALADAGKRIRARPSVEISHRKNRCGARRPDPENIVVVFFMHAKILVCAEICSLVKIVCRQIVLFFQRFRLLSQGYNIP